MLTKKEARHQIAAKLETALADLKPGMSEKKFKSRIKKASKLFGDVSPKTSTPAKPKKAVKKTATRKKAAEPVKP